MRLLLPLMLVIVGCAGPSEDDTLLAARIANRIDTDPGSANLLLQAEDVEPEEFRDWLYEIAADPELTALYLEAREQPSRNPYRVHPRPQSEED